MDAYLYDANRTLLKSVLVGYKGTYNFSWNLIQGQTYFLKVDGYLGTGKYLTSITLPSDETRKVAYNYSENWGTSATKTSDSIAQGAAIDLTPTAYKEGWTFVGWNTTKDATTGLTSLTMGGSDVTLYAIYKKNLTAYFKDYYGTTLYTRSSVVTIYNKDTGGYITVPGQYTYTGWYGRGWSTDSSPTASVMYVAGSCYIGGDLTFYGLYYRSLALSYNAGGGTPTPATQYGTQYANSYNITYTANPSLTVAGAISRSGFSFDGWAVGSVGGAKYSAGSSITLASAALLYAIWKTGGDDYGNSFTDAWTWNVSAGWNSLNGNIEQAKDADMFKFVAPSSGYYNFYITNKAGTLIYLDGYLYNSAQNCIASQLVSSYGLFSLTSYLSQGQTFYLKVDGYLGTGTYTVNMSPLSVY